MVGEKGLTPEVADRIGDYVQQHGEELTLTPSSHPTAFRSKAETLVCVDVCGREREGQRKCVCVCVYTRMLVQSHKKAEPLSFFSW